MGKFKFKKLNKHTSGDNNHEITEVIWFTNMFKKRKYAVLNRLVYVSNKVFVSNRSNKVVDTSASYLGGKLVGNIFWH